MNEIKQGKNIFYIGNDEINNIGRIAFFEDGEGRLVVDHTYVLPEYRGQNIAHQLASKMVEFARSVNKKIIPKCSFVYDLFTKNKDEYQDVWETNHEYDVVCNI